MVDLLSLFVILLVSVLTVASSSIGIQCMNKAGDKTSTNHSYLVFILVVGIFGIIASMGFGAYKHFNPPVNALKLS